jgi:hypothetical protein
MAWRKDVAVDTRLRFSLLLRGVLQVSCSVVKVFQPKRLYFISFQFPNSNPYQLHYIVHDSDLLAKYVMIDLPLSTHTHTHTHTHTSDRYAEFLDQKLINYSVYYCTCVLFRQSDNCFL